MASGVWRVVVRGMVACAALGLGCGGEEAARAPARASLGDVANGAPVVATVRVEEGVTVMEHDAGTFDRAPRLALDAPPLAVLGGAEGDAEYDLTYAHYVEPLADGRVAAFASIGNRLMVFGANGRGERVIGRTGQGPGEFMSVGGMAVLPGDTLFLPDVANARLNWVLPDRGVVVSRPFVDARRLTPFSTLAGALGDGRLVMHAAGLGQEGVADSIVRPPVPVVVLDAASGTARAVASVPDMETAMLETRFRGRRRLSSMPLRFTRRAHVVAWDTLIATGIGDGYAVELRAADGRVVSRLRVTDVPRRTVTPRMRALQIALELGRFDAGGGERAIDPAESRRLRREAPFADSLPPYERLFVTPDRTTLWIVDAIAPGDTSWTATAFRTDGAIVGRLHAAGSATPVAFGDDRVVVRIEDDDGIVTLRVHRLVPAG